MAITTEASTGSNTSATQQAVVKVQVGGCITSSLKDALESQLVIEFPDAIRGNVGLSALSSVAVNQIVTQLVASTQFATDLAAAISTEEYITQVVTAVLGSTQFQTDLTEAIKAALDSEDNIATIETALCASDTFQNCVNAFVVASTDFTAAVNHQINEVVNELGLFVCETRVFTLDPSKLALIEITNMNSNNYFVSWNVRNYTGSGNSNNSYPAASPTPTSYPIVFPNAFPGDTVELEYLRVRCDI